MVAPVAYVGGSLVLGPGRSGAVGGARFTDVGFFAVSAGEIGGFGGASAVPKDVFVLCVSIQVGKSAGTMILCSDRGAEDEEAPTTSLRGAGAEEDKALRD